MAPHRAGLHRPDPRQSGRIKFLTIALLGALVAGSYFLFVWMPLEVDNFDVAKDCDAAVNKTWRFKDTDHARLEFLNMVHAIGKHPENQGGEVVQVPNINPSQDDLDIEIDNSVDPPILFIDVHYGRTVMLPGLNREHTFWFHDHCEQSIQDVNWKH